MLDKKIHTLYLCYFGLREPLVQTQVLPYLRELVKGGIKVSLLTYEPNPKKSWANQEISEMREKLAAENISWHFLTYHKTPSAPSTLFDVLNGAKFAQKLAKKEKIDVFHGRVHVPMMIGWFANKTLKRKPKLLFDIRGFFPEEYVDAGIWEKDSRVYKAVKRAEKWLLRDSDAFVTLTEKARDILFPESKTDGFDKQNRPVEVIPCCVDLEKFNIANAQTRGKMRAKLNIGNRPAIVYVGSFGGFYMTEETANFYGAAKKKNPDTFALILTQSPPEMIKPLLEAQGYSENDYFIQKVKPSEIPLYLSAADLAISFIKPSYSKIASSPTKNAEYLACGLPLIANSKVGDTAEMIIEDKTGVVIDDFSDETFDKALEQIFTMLENREELAQRCKASAKKRFDLREVGGKRYLNIYRKLAEKM